MRTLALAAFSLSLVAQSAWAQSDAPPAPPGGADGPAQVAPVAEVAPAAQPTEGAVAEPHEAAEAPAAAQPSSAAAADAQSAAQSPEPAPTTEEASATTALAPATPQRVSLQAVPRTAPRVRGDAGAPLLLGIGGGLAWNKDKAYDLADAADRTPQLDVLVHYDVLQLSQPLVLSLGASLRRGHADGDRLSILDRVVQAELMLRYAKLSWLWPHVRASAGAGFTRVKVSGDGSPGAMEADDRGWVGSLGGGFTLKTPTRAFENRAGKFASLSFGVLVEAGYTWGAEATFSAVASGGSNDVKRNRVDLGNIERNAAYLRIAAVTRF